MNGSRTEPLRLVLLAAIAAAIAAIFFSRFVLLELNARRLAVPVALALAEALAMLGVGRGAQLLVQRILGRSDEGSPRIRVDLIAGYPLFGAICFLAGLISTSAPLMTALLLVGVAGGALVLRGYLRRETVRSVELGPAVCIAGGLLAGALATGLLNAQLPAVTLDEVAYHLAVPRIWVNEGRVVELPLLSHSYFPLGIESADIPLLSLLGAGGAIASHVLHLLVAIAAVMTMFSWLEKRLPAGLAIVGTAAVVTTPALLITAGWSWNEWPLLGVCIALLAALDSGERQPSGGIVAALIAAGLLTKYSFPLFALAVLFARRDRSILKPALIGSAAGSIFYIRNLIETGNPVAPLLGRLAPHVASYRDSFVGYIFDGNFLDESLGIAAVALAIGALVLLPAERFLRWCTLALLAAAVLVAFGRPSSRLLLPFLVPLALIGWTRLARVRIAWVAVSLAAIQLFLTWVYLSRLQPFDLLSGAASDEQYAVAQRRPLSSVLWTDSRLPRGSRTLILGASELFWFSRPVRGGGNFDANRISDYLSRDLPQRLRRDGITHIAVIGDGLRVGSIPPDKKEQERVTTLDPAAAIQLRETLGRHATLVAAEQNRAIYIVNR